MHADPSQRPSAPDVAGTAPAPSPVVVPATPVATNARRIARAPLLILVFVAGVVSLGLEMCGPRLMAPYFGTSLFIWANQIGFTLIYLSLGYFIGGRLADHYPSLRLLCSLTMVAALATGLIPFVSQPVLDWSVSGLTQENASVFASSLVVVILLFSVPTILLGMVAPFALRLTVERVGTAGTSAGSLYALSTVGSIVGAFLPVLVLIPAWGVRRTLFTGCVVLVVASLWGLRPRVRIAASVPAAILLAPLLLPQVVPLGPLKQVPGLIYYQESLYNYIQVVREADGTHDLILNEGADAIHSRYNPNTVLFGPSWYTDYMLTAPYFNSGAAAGRVRRLAIIGLAGGTVVRQYTAAYGAIPIDGAEIDPAIVAVGRRYFGMTEPNLHVYIGDGRTFIRTTHNVYDVAVIDAYQQPYIPFQLATREFFTEIRAHFSPDGVLVVNTGHTCTDRRLVQAIVNTLYAAGFPSVYTMDVPGSINTEIFATDSQTSLGIFQHNLRAVPATSLIAAVAPAALAAVRVARATPGGTIFTDDRAPIEQITDQLIISYLQHNC